MGNATIFEYDLNGNPVKTTNANGTVTRTYDALNRVTSVTDFYGNVTSYTYDALNREVRTDNANLTYVIKEYDAVSNLTKMSEYFSKTGSVITKTIYEYDADDRQTAC